MKQLRKCECEYYKVNEQGRPELVTTNGLFHSWGTDYDEFENGIGNYVVGIVELEDGNVIHSTYIKFLDK